MQNKHLERLVFVLLLVIWLMLFLNGALNNSKLYLDQYIDSNSLSVTIKSFALLALTWTWSNLLIICCLSSLMGEYGRITMGPARKIKFTAGLMRGFFIFFFLSAGQFIIEGKITLPQYYEDPQVVKEIEQAYIRLAFVCTLFGFVVGFKPNFFFESVNKFIGETGNGMNATQ